MKSFLSWNLIEWFFDSKPLYFFFCGNWNLICSFFTFSSHKRGHVRFQQFNRIWKIDYQNVSKRINMDFFQQAKTLLLSLLLWYVGWERTRNRKVLLQLENSCWNWKVSMNSIIRSIQLSTWPFTFSFFDRPVKHPWTVYFDQGPFILNVISTMHSKAFVQN